MTSRKDVVVDCMVDNGAGTTTFSIGMEELRVLCEGFSIHHGRSALSKDNVELEALWCSWMRSRGMPQPICYDLAQYLLTQQSLKGDISFIVPAGARSITAGTVMASIHTEKPVGDLLNRFCQCVLTKKAYARTVRPQIADMRYEHAEAIKRGDRKAARLIVWRGYFHVIYPFAYGLFTMVVTILKLAK